MEEKKLSRNQLLDMKKAYRALKIMLDSEENKTNKILIQDIKPFVDLYRDQIFKYAMGD